MPAKPMSKVLIMKRVLSLRGAEYTSLALLAAVAFARDLSGDSGDTANSLIFRTGCQ